MDVACNVPREEKEIYPPLTPTVEGYWKNCPLIFLQWSAQNTNFLSSQDRKLDTFFDPENAETFMCQCCNI